MNTSYLNLSAPKSRQFFSLSAKVHIFVDWVSELIQQDPIFQAR